MALLKRRNDMSSIDRSRLLLPEDSDTPPASTKKPRGDTSKSCTLTVELVQALLGNSNIKITRQYKVTTTTQHAHVVSRENHPVLAGTRLALLFL
jgi:hypothetical protein